MYEVSSKQYKAFSNVRRQVFIDRCCEKLIVNFPSRCSDFSENELEKHVSSLIDVAESLDIQMQRSVFKFIWLDFVAPSYFKHPYVDHFFRLDCYSGTEKVDLLYRRVSDNVRGN